MRKADVFLMVTSGLILTFVGLVFVHPLFQTGHEAVTTAARRLVRELKLTDLCLFTEARYTRNITQADLHAPFQDHPFSFEHFPSGSILPPPAHLTRTLPESEVSVRVQSAGEIETPSMHPSPGHVKQTEPRGILDERPFP